MSFAYHLVLGIASAVFFFVEFTVYRKVYQLLFGLLALYTFLVYLSPSQTFHMVLGAFGVVLAVVAFMSMQRTRKLEQASKLEHNQTIQPNPKDEETT